MELLYDQIVIFKQLAQVLPVCKGAHLFLIFRLHAQADKRIGHIICCQAILHGLFKIGNIFQSFAGVGAKIDPIYGKESIGKAADGIKLLFQLSVYAAQLYLFLILLRNDTVDQTEANHGSGTAFARKGPGRFRMMPLTLSRYHTEAVHQTLVLRQICFQVLRVEHVYEIRSRMLFNVLGKAFVQLYPVIGKVCHIAAGFVIQFNGAGQGGIIAACRGEGAALQRQRPVFCMIVL